MPLITRSIRWSSRLVVVGVPLALMGCGGSPTPPETVAIAPVVSDQQRPNDQVQYFPPGPEFPYENTQAATLRARMAAQGIPTPPAEPTRDDVKQTAAEVREGADDLKGNVTRAVGDARDQAQQATDQAVSEVQAGVSSTVQEAKDGLQSAADSAKGQVQSAVAGARANARTKVNSAVSNAEAQARQKAKAAGAQVQKSAEAMEGKVLDGLFGPDGTSPTAPSPK